eukprot:1870574-Pleurochrysis_carterae.AAC.4
MTVVRVSTDCCGMVRTAYAMHLCEQEYRAGSYIRFPTTVHVFATVLEKTQRPANKYWQQTQPQKMRLQLFTAALAGTEKNEHRHQYMTRALKNAN